MPVNASHPKPLLRSEKDSSEREASFTIFAIPKPFSGAADRIQRNAIGSWKRLAPHAEILLLGDDAGVNSVAAEFRVQHVADVQRNEHGTPLLDSAFTIANEVATTPLLVYCNCDLILLDDFAETMKRLHGLLVDPFLGYGRRLDVSIDYSIEFDSPAQVDQLRSFASRFGRIDSIVCKEYFVFRRGSFASIPPFAVGRGNWDNWMVRSAKQRSLPVIDLSAMVLAIHQSHDYSHVQKNRWRCYVSGPEAQMNQFLAGGRHLIGGSTPTWRLDSQGLHKIRFSRLNLPFWRDSPRFLRLMKQLVFG